MSTIPAHYKTDPWEPEGTRAIYGTTRGGRVQVKIVDTDHAHGNVAAALHRCRTGRRTPGFLQTGKTF